MSLVRASGARCRSPLLIVDDQVPVLRALRRVLGLHFESVLIAACPSEAEHWLATERPPLLLCDYWLGDTTPPAVEWIPAWQRRYGCLRRVALMTGTHSSAFQGCPAVDATFQKPIDSDEVARFFITGSASAKHRIASRS